MPCKLCQYLASHPLTEQKTSKTFSASAVTRFDSTSDSAGLQRHLPNSSNKPSHRITFHKSCFAQTATNQNSDKQTKTNGPTTCDIGLSLRPSKSLRSNNAIIQRSSKLTGRENTIKPKVEERNAKQCHGNVILLKSLPLQPVPLPPPESAFSSDSCTIPPRFQETSDNVAEGSTISPHLMRVLKKQYSQHLEWMASHGTNEAGLRKLEKDYEDFMQRHTVRFNQIRKEMSEQARVNALKTQKGMN